MDKIIFEDYPSINTPLNADNLNALQNNIENAMGNIDTSRISAIENKDIEQDGRLDNIEGAIENATSDIEAKDIEQDGRLDSLEANNPIVLGNTENLNDLRTNKNYIQFQNANTSTSRNYPVASAGFLEVITSGDRVLQRYTLYHNRNVYVRTYYNGTWYPWKEMIQEPNVATAVLKGNYNFTSTTLNLSGWEEKYIRGAKLSIVNNGVKALINCNLKISSTLFYRHLGAGGLVAPVLDVLVNGTQIITIPHNNMNETSAMALNMTPIVVTANANDVVRLRVRGGAINDYIAGHHSTTGDRAYLTVEVIE